jgi:hypothetical protein
VRGRLAAEAQAAQVKTQDLAADVAERDQRILALATALREARWGVWLAWLTLLLIRVQAETRQEVVSATESVADMRSQLAEVRAAAERAWRDRDVLQAKVRSLPAGVACTGLTPCRPQLVDSERDATRLARERDEAKGASTALVDELRAARTALEDKLLVAEHDLAAANADALALRDRVRGRL